LGHTVDGEGTTSLISFVELYFMIGVAAFLFGWSGYVLWYGITSLMEEHRRDKSEDKRSADRNRNDRGD